MTSSVHKFLSGCAPLNIGVTKRAKCPECKKDNTFTYTREIQGYVYNCYSAGCGVSGFHNVSLDASAIRKLVRSSVIREESSQPVYRIPEYFKPGEEVESVVRCMRRYDCEEFLSDVWYDPKEDRCVVLLMDSYFTTVDAVGKSLSGAIPKWKRYEKSNAVFSNFKVGSSVVVVVEDVFSAMNISKDFSSVALMGTQLTHVAAREISRLTAATTKRTAVIALDKDATTKALAIQKDLQLLCITKVIMLDKDIKDMNIFEREAFVSKVNSLV